MKTIKPTRIIPLAEGRKVIHRVLGESRKYVVVVGWPEYYMPRGASIDDSGHHKVASRSALR